MKKIPNFSFLFVPSNDTHVHWMYPIAKNIDNFDFMVFSNRNEQAEESLRKLNINFLVYEPGLLRTTDYAVLIFGNDWGKQEKEIIAEAKMNGIPTVCIQEGCLDFDDPNILRLQNADYIFLQGSRMLEYLKRDDGLFLTGNPKYDLISPRPFPETPKVMINSNFTYGIFEDVRDSWVKDIVNCCREIGVSFFISQHPRDHGIFPPDYPVINSNAFQINDQLEQSTILVSRFSTTIYEAIFMGRQAIYYNPHGEKFPLFQEDTTGGLFIANNPNELKKVLQSSLNNPSGNRKNQENFLIENCFTLDSNAKLNCVHYLNVIANKHTDPIVKVASLIKFANQQYNEGNLEVSFTALQNVVPSKGPLDETNKTHNLMAGNNSEIYPENPELMLVYGNLLLKNGDFSGAIALFNRSIVSAPYNSAGYSNAAAVYYFLGLKNIAYEFAQTALSIEPFQIEALRISAWCASENQDYEKAEIFYNQILRVLPEDEETLKFFQYFQLNFSNKEKQAQLAEVLKFADDAFNNLNWELALKKYSSAWILIPAKDPQSRTVKEKIKIAQQFIALADK